MAERARQQEEPQDLGFGSVVAQQSRQRLLNRDGSFNVARHGLRLIRSMSVYHTMLTISWPRFLGIVLVIYLLTNCLFSLAYVAAGPQALGGDAGGLPDIPFIRAFFFSVHTLATIGYGNIHPMGLAANIIVTFESLTGLLGLALVTGLFFARFSRPTARILFSRNAVIAPYRGGTAFMFRIANARSNQLIELGAKLLLTLFEERPNGRVRTFHQLKLERTQVAFFPLSWTIVHPIDENSPLHGLTQRELYDSDAEFLILLTGIDETFAQSVHARSSYKPDEIIWGAKFNSILDTRDRDGRITVDIDRIHDVADVELPQIRTNGATRERAEAG